MKILVAGDFCPRDRVTEYFDRNDYASVLGEIKEVVNNADYSIVNFECSVTKGGERPIVKVGPNLSSSEVGIKALEWLGVKGLTLANNHLYDYGYEGILNTLQLCKKYQLDTVGGGLNFYEASKVLYKKIGGKMIAIINCCESEFSIATETSAGCNPLNPIQQYYAIKDAKRQADYVLAIVHGGPEHFQLPSPRMQETYRFFIDAGADAVINHHQHCISGYEIYKEKPIFYGIGNFCFDNKLNNSKLWYDGLLILIEFGPKISFEIIPINQCEKSAKVHLLNYSYVQDKIRELNDIINSPNTLKRAIEHYYDSQINNYFTDIFEPINNRLYFACKSRGWLPTFIGNRRVLIAYNYIWCEAHRDRVLYKLRKLYENIAK